MKTFINNMFRQVFGIVIISLQLIVMLSCQEFVTDDFPILETVPTINSILEAGKPITVYISLAGGLDSLPLSWVNNASVDLYIDGKFEERLLNNEDGSYYSPTIVQPGTAYKCIVVIPNRDTIVCSQTLPYPSQIINVEHINIAGRDEEGTTYPAVKLQFRNNQLVESYYEIVIRYFTNYGHLEERVADIQAIVDPVLLNEGLQMALFSNESIQDTSYLMTINYTTDGASSFGDNLLRTVLHPFVVELRSVTYDYYRYQKQLYLYYEGKYADITESMTVIPLYSNIENGYGIFTGYSVFVSDTITPEPYGE